MASPKFIKVGKMAISLTRREEIELADKGLISYSPKLDAYVLNCTMEELEEARQRGWKELSQRVAARNNPYSRAGSLA